MGSRLRSALEWALSALAIFGYPIVFVATLLENLFVAGSFVPGDVITAGAGVAAATDPSATLSPWLLVGVAALGSMLGANASYWIGRHGGRALVERLGLRFGIDASAVHAAEEFFERHGAVTILLARFVAVLKNLAPALAGASRMNLLLFEAYSLAASLVYSSVLVGVGWFLGANFRAGLHYFGLASWLLLAAVVVVGAWLWRRKRTRVQALIARNVAEYDREHAPGKRRADPRLYR